MHTLHLILVHAASADAAAGIANVHRWEQEEVTSDDMEKEGADEH